MFNLGQARGDSLDGPTGYDDHTCAADDRAQCITGGIEHNQHACLPGFLGLRCTQHKTSGVRFGLSTASRVLQRTPHYNVQIVVRLDVGRIGKASERDSVRHHLAGYPER